MQKVGAKPINLPFVHGDFAGDGGALIPKRIDGNRLFVGERDFRLHHAIFWRFGGPALSRFGGCCYIIPLLLPLLVSKTRLLIALTATP
jgi:hypothetical protein